ncbi:MAG: hypothetical protein PHQ50_03235 [Eubacteriales bacterium]|nr:hypothetical protein [Eubacteriales bacterium]MDD3349629.1 hypothetical protein [Eubacteriales bacterium]
MDNMNKNMIFFSEELVNQELRSVLLSAVSPYISDYRVNFSGGYLFLDATLNIKGIGELSAKYRLKIRDLTFHKNAHTLYLDYDEDIRPAGGAMQSILLKAAGLAGGTYLQKALSMMNLNGIKADTKNCSVDLEQLIDLSKGFLPLIELQYADSRDAALSVTYKVRV